MEHFYQTIGQDWFTYPNLYQSVVQEFQDGAHFVEVGAWKGRSACFLAVEILNSGKKIKLDCVDTFLGSDEHRDPNHQSYDPILETENGLYIEFLKTIQPVREIICPIKLTSLEAATLYPDESLDFVFIDAAHDYNNVKADILAWKDKVKVGGILAGHDYSWCQDVKMAVDEIFEKVEESEGCWIWRKIERPRRVYDCFTFFNEVDLLELRLKHLWKWVDKFVIVEADKTHRNKPKDWILEKFLDGRLNWARDKIIYIQKSIPDDLPKTSYRTDIENFNFGDNVDTLYMRIDNFQRNAISEGLYEAYLDDIIMIGDLDEFPNNVAMDEIHIAANSVDRYCFVMRNFCYYLDIENRTTHFWCGTVIGKKRFLTTPQEWRDVRELLHWQAGRGFHFSWLAKYLNEKIKNTAHAEVENYQLNSSLIYNGDGTFKDLFNRPDHFCFRPNVEAESDYPDVFIEFSENYPDLFLHQPTKRSDPI